MTIYIKNLILLSLPWLLCCCGHTNSGEKHTADESKSLLDSIMTNEGEIVRYGDVSISPNGLIVDSLGNTLTCRVYSNVISDDSGIMYEDVVDGEVTGLTLYHPNGMLAYKIDANLNYNGEFYSPDGDLIDFDSFADKYWRIWHDHEFEVPITIICPACLNDILDYEKQGDNYKPDDNATFRLQNKNKKGTVMIIKNKP